MSSGTSQLGVPRFGGMPRAAHPLPQIIARENPNQESLGCYIWPPTVLPRVSVYESPEAPPTQVFSPTAPGGGG